MPSEITRLSPEDEKRFQRWIAANRIPDLDHPDSHYDYRGYWKKYGDKPVRFGVDHFTDEYKQHGHPTFSVESNYSRGLQDGGQWIDNTLVAPPMPSHVQSGLSSDVVMMLANALKARN